MGPTPVVAFLALAALMSAGCAPQPTRERPPVSGALHRAAWEGRTDELRALLAAGQAVDARERGSEWTPLHAAAAAGQVAAASLLLDRGADPNARGRFDLTPLHWAALRGRAQVAALLLRRGARLDARNIYGMTPLHEVADDKVARVLLDAGADPRAVDDRGMTPLHRARNKRVARALLERRADLRQRARDGRTAWETAVWDQLEPQGLTLSSARASARLRGDEGRVEIMVRNVGVRPLQRLGLAALSPACTVGVSPGVVPRFEPGQLAIFVLSLHRRPGVGDGEHPLSLTATAGGATLGVVQLRVDSTRGEIPEDRGEIRLGKGALRPPPSRWQYLAYAAVPALVVVAWLAWRRRR